MTRQSFIHGFINVRGNQVFGNGPTPLLTDLNNSQLRRLAFGVNNPYFWAGIELMGTPW